jgi:hypothetical protein
MSYFNNKLARKKAALAMLVVGLLVTASPLLFYVLYRRTVPVYMVEEEFVTAMNITFWIGIGLTAAALACLGKRLLIPPRKK